MLNLRSVVLVGALAAAGYYVAPAAVAAPGSGAGAGDSAVALTATHERALREVTLPVGTLLSLRLGTAVSSRSSRVEDPVTATLRRPIVIDGVTVVPAGAAVSGYVSQAERPGRVKGRARIGVRFTSLRVDEAVYRIRTAGINRIAPATKGEDATKIAIGAGSGAVIGAIADGKKGAAIGSAVGGAGGTGVVLATRGREVALSRGVTVTTRLTEPLTIRVR